MTMMQDNTRLQALSAVCAISLACTLYLLYRDYTVETRLSTLEAHYSEILTQKNELLSRRRRDLPDCACPAGNNHYNKLSVRANCKVCEKEYKQILDVPFIHEELRHEILRGKVQNFDHWMWCGENI
jgi:hypothetical protein